jgi:hypothetical protein
VGHPNHPMAFFRNAVLVAGNRNIVAKPGNHKVSSATWCVEGGD